nr:MAG TPA: hypothetical protein [Caudoviricetes sp.]
MLSHCKHKHLEKGCFYYKHCVNQWVDEYNSKKDKSWSTRKNNSNIVK